MPGFKGLAVPGPTNMPFRVRQAMDVALEDHRAPDFPAFTLPLFADLKKIFQTTTGQVFIFPGSGTGGWESAIANTLSPGDTVLASVFGQFSLLWVDLCQRFGLDVDAIDVEWGKGVPLDLYRAHLEADKTHAIKAVLVTQNETATGVTSTSPVCAASWMTSSTLRCCSSTASVRSPRSTSGWTNGVSTSPSPARRRASCCRPASRSSASARRRWRPARPRNCRAASSTIRT